MDQSPVQVHTCDSTSYGGQAMETTHDAWVEAVEQAAARQDSIELAELFRQARAIWGPQDASRMWLAVMSGFDASAVTG